MQGLLRALLIAMAALILANTVDASQWVRQLGSYRAEDVVPTPDGGVVAIGNLGASEPRVWNWTPMETSFGTASFSRRRRVRSSPCKLPPMADSSSPA